MVKNKFGVPCSGFKGLIEDVDVHCPSEETAMGLAAGCALCGKTATVYTQNSGLMRIADIVLSLYKPYNIKLPKLLLSLRKKPKHHQFVGNITMDFLKLIGYDGEIKIVEEK